MQIINVNFSFSHSLPQVKLGIVFFGATRCFNFLLFKEPIVSIKENIFVSLTLVY